MRPLLWIVTDQLPYPPRNGITLPVYNYILHLKNYFQIQLILLIDQDHMPAQKDVDANKLIVDDIFQILLKRHSRLKRMLLEITGKEMYQHGWQGSLDFDKPELQKADALLVSPMSAVAKWRASGGEIYTNNIPSAAAVNDCTTAEYFYRGLTQIGGLKHRIKSRIDYIRSGQIGRIEHKLLSSYKAIFLQTERDKQLLEKLTLFHDANKAILAPNGVNKDYLKIVREPNNKLLFVGELSGEYGGIIYWLLSEVWPSLAHRHKHITLLIVGKGANFKLKSLISSSDRVEHLEYVENLADVYASSLLAICPIFKGFGLINKTIEAMASGLPVVGGIAAFNGIPGFEADIHGAVCKERTAEEFIATLHDLIANELKREKIGMQGKSLISTGFSWDTSIDRIASMLKTPH